MLFCKLSCKRMFCWIRHVRRHVTFCQSRCLRGCVIFGKNVSRIWHWKDTLVFATPFNTSLVFTSYREMAQRTSHSILADSCHVHWLMLIWLNLVASVGWSSCYWIMFGVCYWTGLLVSWQQSWNHTKELLQNRFTTPFFYKPSFPPTSLVSRLKERLKYSRTQNKISLENPKPPTSCQQLSSAGIPGLWHL